MNLSPSRRTALTAAGAAAASVTGLVGTARAATPAAKSDTTGDSVVIHPTLPSVPLNTAFTVKVRPAGGTWQKLDTYLVKLAQIDPLTGRNQAQNSCMAAFDFSGTVEVEVTYNPGGAEKVRIRPDSYGITPEVLGSTARLPSTAPATSSSRSTTRSSTACICSPTPSSRTRPSRATRRSSTSGPACTPTPTRR